MRTLALVIWSILSSAFALLVILYWYGPVEQKIFDYRQIVREWRLRHTFGRHYGRAR